MELEKLKEIWTTLDNRMQQQEVLKTTLIKEMLINKSDKALNRLINYNYFGIFLLISMLPLLAWYWTVAISINFIGWVMVPVAFVFMFFALTMGIIQLKKLHQINFSLPINENMYIMRKFNLFNKRFLILGNIFGFLFVLAMIVIILISNRIELWRWWIIAAAIFLGTLISIWEYKRMYRRNIDSILKSLEELKELEETE